MRIRRLVNVMVTTCAAMFLLLLAGFAINFQNSRSAAANNHFAEEIRAGVNELRFIMLETALYDVPRAREQWQSKHAAMRAVLDRQSFDDQEARTLLQRIHDNHDTADVLYRRLAETRASIGNWHATKGNSEVYERTLSTGLLITQEMGSDARELSRLSQESIVAVQKVGEILILIAGLMVSTFSVWVWWLVRRRVLKPIVLVHKGANALTAGNLEHRVGLIGRDEIAELAAAFDHMAQRLQFSSGELNRTVDTIKQQKEALQASEESLAITLHSIGDAVIATDPAGRVTRMNATAERLTGWTLSEAMGRPLSEVFRIVNTDSREAVADPVQSVMAHGQVVGLANHTALLARDGHEYQIADSAAPIRNAAGAIAGVVLVFSDVTEQYRVEEALRVTRFSVDAASDALFWMTPDARIVDVNAAACRILGYTREELLQLRVPDVDAHYNEGLWPRHFAELRQRGSMTFESEQRAKDGSLIPVEIVANYVVYGSEERNCAFVRDITGRKQAEKEKALLEAQVQQAQKMDSVGRLAGGVAHDFNNMLTVILGNVAMAIEQADPTHPLYADLNEIRKAANRSADLTRQLLAFARKQVVEPKVLDLNETVSGILKMLRRLIGEDISLKWLPEANLWRVKVDPSQLDQILANLCVNARDAIAGVGNIAIETGNSTFDEDYCAVHAGFAPGDYVRISVSDNGHGIDKETLAHIFEPFFTTKGVGEGTGLGLATVYGVAKQNNGFINVYSEPDTGTTFTIYLPRHAGGAEQGLAAVAAGPLVRGQETILLVEDEPSILKLTTRVLTRQGYVVLAANSPGKAIRLASEQASAIHLLMTDVVMPEMNGRDLAKDLQSRHPGLKLLFMSGYTANIIAHQGVLDQGAQFIQKPFSIDDLAAKVRAVLDSE